MKEFLFFIHIPKTAGSSFLSILQRIYKERLLAVYGPMNAETPFTNRQLSEWSKHDSARFDCLASHRLSTVFPEEVNGRKSLAVSFVRDPLDHFKSHYFYHRFHVNGFDRARDLSLEEYFTYALEEGNYPHYPDWQFNILTGRGLPNSDRPDMSRITELVNTRKLLLFPTESFDSACLLLKKRHPSLFKSVWYRRRNTSKKDQESNDQELRERSKIFFQRDYQLIKMAKAQHSDLVAEFFPDSDQYVSSLEEFQSECNRAKAIDIPRTFAKRAFLKIGRSL